MPHAAFVVLFTFTYLLKGREHKETVRILNPSIIYKVYNNFAKLLFDHISDIECLTQVQEVCVCVLPTHTHARARAHT